jgi:hypothetical protein
LVADLVSAIWIYRDAVKRGARAKLWGILGFIFPIVTFIIWLIVRPKPKTA